MLKGIRTAEDAVLCAEHGVDGVVVSNHGGRQLDSTRATIETLPAIAEAVGDRVEVYLDSGVRRGRDVLTALALGARAVLVGRPLFWGLAIDGEAGVRQMLEILRVEFDRAMANCGRTSVAQIDRRLATLPCQCWTEMGRIQASTGHQLVDDGHAKRIRPDGRLRQRAPHGVQHARGRFRWARPRRPAARHAGPARNDDRGVRALCRAGRSA